MRRTAAWITAALAVVTAAWYWWPRSPEEILPADPNSFIKAVTIVPLTLDHDGPRPRITLPNGMTVEDTERVSLVQNPEGAQPFAETFEIDAGSGQYIQVELESFETHPSTIDGREVASTDRWPITFAVYRRDDSPDEAREFQCFVTEGTVERPPQSEANRHPPPWLVDIGVSGLRSDFGYAGIPDIDLPEEGRNLYWTFFSPPDEENPAGEYVYEVRLYPTARWVSDIRSETGDPIVLRRGLLIAVDGNESPTNDDAGDSG